jgi:hypothetical protein
MSDRSLVSQSVREFAVTQSRAAEQGWIFRPRPSRPADVVALSGARVHGAGAVDTDGTREIVLQDGTRVRADRAEVVIE